MALRNAAADCDLGALRAALAPAGAE
eukprot:COSAG01_NODE_72399_length_253_cov_0.662338_1_plen_25_part_01